ncbi:hypothetical protein [Bellilinea caldifistulae]|uniref:hypothetical protein n=1 Tax=Bellilinea caldifistulae TaxID=360411 RepID=UPI0012F9A796|nr:hypothetical protein [Bellilinea caldifistulae]
MVHLNRGIFCGCRAAVSNSNTTPPADEDFQRFEEIVSASAAISPTAMAGEIAL